MTHRVVRIAALTALTALAAASGLPAAGCRVSPNKAAEPAAEIAEYNARLAEANRLAAEAQKAMEAGDSPRAISLYRQSIDASGDFPDVWNNLGLLLLQSGDLGPARSAFSRAAELDPTDPRAYYNMGVTNLRAQWAEDAIEDFKKALAISPSYLPALRGAIQAADLLGRAEYEDLDRVKRALLAEHDERWKAFFERQRYLIESRLKSAKKHDDSMPD